jgi:hypothetical protein
MQLAVAAMLLLLQGISAAARGSTVLQPTATMVCLQIQSHMPLRRTLLLFFHLPLTTLLLFFHLPLTPSDKY